MVDLFVGQKLYSLNDSSPWGDVSEKERLEQRGKPWYTFESCKIVKVNPKTVKVKVREANAYSGKSWSTTFLIPFNDVGYGWCVSKAEALEEELEDKVADLNEAKREVRARQVFVSRLKGMLNTQKKKRK